MNSCDLNRTRIDKQNSPTLASIKTFTELHPVENPESSYDYPIDTAQNVQHHSESCTNKTYRSLDTLIHSSTSSNQAPIFSQAVDQEINNNLIAQPIKIKHQVRTNDRLRTRMEHEKAAHFIHCEENEDEEAKYPSVYVDPKWAEESDENYIDVTLLQKTNITHLYEIDYKREKASKANEQENLVQKVNDLENTLRFRLTPNDFKKGFKTFEIQIIKSTIPEIARKMCSTQIDTASEPTPKEKTEAKTYILQNELHVSKLCFTRIYRHRTINSNQLCVVYESTVHSSEMIDTYSSAGRIISVDCVVPQYGPMKGGKDLLVIFKNLKATDKDKLSFKIHDETNSWFQWIEHFELQGSNVRLQIPPYPTMGNDVVKVTVTILYDNQPIFDSPFIYSTAIDDAIIRFRIQSTDSNENDLTKDSKTKKRSSLSVSPKKQKKIRTN